VDVDAGVRRQMPGYGAVADADFEVRKWQDSARYALQRPRLVLGHRQFARTLVSDKIQTARPLCKVHSSSNGTIRHEMIYSCALKR